jgi:hypothetical protein
MAVAMFMYWPEITGEQYDAMISRLDLDVNPAAGLFLHLAAVTDEGLEVCDVWQTEQAFHGFLEHRIMPAVEELRIAGEPAIRVIPLHNLFTADPDMLDRIGAVSLPAAVAAWAG